MLKLAVSLAILSGSLAADAHEWKARWISRAQCSSGDNSWIAFRKSVNLESVPSSLKARIAADSKYWLWINGELVVFEGGLKRGPAPGDGYYDVVEIAPCLKTGENVIAVLVDYFGKSGFSHMSGGIAALLFEAVGDGVEIISDDSWDACQHFSYSRASSPVPNYRLSESSVRYDARRFRDDWFKGGKKMGSAFELGIEPGSAPLGRLVERPIPMWKDYGLKDYDSVRRSGDTLVCTLPYNAHFSPYMRLKAPAGKLVRLFTDHAKVTGEHCVTGEYVTRGGEQEYEMLSWMNGQYMYYIIPEGVEVSEVKFRETGYDCGFTGTFSCGDPVLDSFWTKAGRTLYACMRDTWMDCPDRERAQWWGDEVHELAQAFYMLSPSSWDLTRKGIRELCAWARADGSMYAPVPCSNWFRELAQQSLASVGWYGFRQFAFYSGDYSFVEDIYPAVHKYLHETWQPDADGLPIERTKGWNWADAGKNVDKTALLHPWYYLALKGEADFAVWLSEHASDKAAASRYAADAAEDRAMMERIAEAYNRLYWTGSAYASPDFAGNPDDRVQALAVVSGLASPDKYAALASVMDGTWEAETYFMRYIVEAYCVMGMQDKAIGRLRAFATSVMKEEYSTLWEQRNHIGSSNHAWTGGALIPLFENIAGIKPLAPGFREFSVAPRLGSLKHVSFGFDSACGRIEVEIERKGRSRINASISVPEGSAAVLTDYRGRGLRLGPGRHDVRL